MIGTSMIKEITCYQNSDGHIWTTLEQAEFWETVLRKIKKVPSKEAAPEKSFRSWGEDEHIDRYAGRGC